jgi:hypothetical protein
VKLRPLNLTPIASTRKVRSDTELRQFLLSDEQDVRAAAARWLRETHGEALVGTLAAGNPPHYTIEIDGATSGSGKVKRGRAFKAGSVASATRSIRTSFVGGELAPIANQLKPQLLRLIEQTFPNSQTKQLGRKWEWWVQRDALIAGKSTPAHRLGPSVPDSIGIYDVLWLAPQAETPAAYAWFANRLALGDRGNKWNLRKSKRAPGGSRRVRRPRGFMAEATRKMRGSKAQQQVGPVTIQAMFLRQSVLTASSNRATKRGGLPVIRLAFRRALARALPV